MSNFGSEATRVTARANDLAELARAALNLAESGLLPTQIVDMVDAAWLAANAHRDVAPTPTPSLPAPGSGSRDPFTRMNGGAS